MEVVAWLALIVLATGVLVAMFWASIRWLKGVGPSWIASFLRSDTRSEHRDGHHQPHG